MRFIGSQAYATLNCPSPECPNGDTHLKRCICSYCAINIVNDGDAIDCADCWTRKICGICHRLGLDICHHCNKFKLKFGRMKLATSALNLSKLVSVSLRGTEMPILIESPFPTKKKLLFHPFFNIIGRLQSSRNITRNPMLLNILMTGLKIVTLKSRSSGSAPFQKLVTWVKHWFDRYALLFPQNVDPDMEDKYKHSIKQHFEYLAYYVNPSQSLIDQTMFLLQKTWIVNKVCFIVIQNV